VSELAELEGNVAEACEGDHQDEKFIKYMDRCIEYTSRATKIGKIDEYLVVDVLGSDIIDKSEMERREEW
jgi:hypothetical protein